MEEKYKVFNIICNELLNFVEFADKNLIEDYKKIIDSLPPIIIEKIKEHKEFSHKVNGFYYSLTREGENMLSFKCSNFPSPIKVSVLFQPITQNFLDTLNSDDNGRCFIFRLVMTNTRSEPTLKINYEENNGVLQYKNTEMNGKEIDYDVYIHKKNDQLFLTSRKCFNWHELYCKKEELTLDDFISLLDDDLNDYYETLER